MKLCIKYFIFYNRYALYTFILGLLASSFYIPIKAQYSDFQAPAWHPSQDIIAVTNGTQIRLYPSDFSVILDEYNLVSNPEASLIRHGEMRWSPDGTMLAISITGNDVTPVLQIWNLQTGQLVTTIESIVVDEPFSWNSDSTQIVVIHARGLGDEVIRVFDVTSGGLLQEFVPPSPATIGSLMWSQDGGTMAFHLAGDNEGTFILDVDTDTFTQSPVNFNPSIGYQLSPTGSFLAGVINWDDTDIQVLDIMTLQIDEVLAGHTDRIRSITWIDNAIVTVGRDETTRFWNPMTGQQIRQLNTGLISDPSFNADGTLFVSNTDDNTIYVRDSVTGAIIYPSIPTPTPTSPPTMGDFTVTSRIDGQDDTQQSIFAYTLTNSSSIPQSNMYMRVFFTVDNGRSADDYLLQSYYDSSNALVITGPFVWDANNHYFILSYGASALAPSANYQFQGVLRLSDWSNNHSASNDWWHTGILNFQDSLTDYLPVYSNGTLNTGLEPSGAPQATNTPAPTQTPAPTNTPDGTALLQVESRIDGSDDTQQAGFRYRLSNISTQAQANLSTRIYFTLDSSQVAGDYVLEQYFDQSGVASVSGPTLASSNTYYFQVDYGTTSLQPNSAWEFQGALHLVNYVSNFNSGNDWWHTGIGSAYQNTDYFPTYINATLEVGQEP